jgi:hypothetical protein
MKPSQISFILRKIATNIENSKKPHRDLVSKDLRKVLAALTQPLSDRHDYGTTAALQVKDLPGEFLEEWGDYVGMTTEKRLSDSAIEYMVGIAVPKDRLIEMYGEVPSREEFLKEFAPYFEYRGLPGGRFSEIDDVSIKQGAGNNITIGISWIETWDI